MSLLICPECGAENPPEAEICSACQASLVEIPPIEPEQPQPTDPDEKALLPQDDEDLPALLHSLKQDDDLSDFPADEGEDFPPSSSEETEAEDLDELEDEPDLPEWLNRIRERAQTETDSVGDITQRIRAARESLDEDNQETQHRQYESVIQNIHGNGEEEPFKEEPVEQKPAEDTSPVEETSSEEISSEETPPAEELPSAAQDPDETGETDWLSRIRKKIQPDPVEDVVEEQEGKKLFDRDGDSLLQWLVALEEDEASAEAGIPGDKPQDGATDEDTREVEVPTEKGDATQEIPVGLAKSTRVDAPVLQISQEDQDRADQLAATIFDERSPRSIRQRLKGFSPRGIRLLMGILLVAVLSFALFLPAPVNLPPALQGPHSLAVMEWAQGLPEEASLLIVLNYQAGYSAELDLISKPVLDPLFMDGREISILTSSPSGGLLFDRFLEDSGLADRLEVNDLGFYPVESFGAYGLASHLLSDWRITSQPAFAKALPSGPLDGIIILADEYEGAMAWVEQLSSLVPETPIFLLATSQTVPLLLPYWESGQVMGIAGGMPDAVNLTDASAGLTSRWRAYQAGVLLVIVLLLIGITFPQHMKEVDEGRNRQ